MNEYEVSWVEYHNIYVKAKDEDSAYDKAFDTKENTCRNIGQEEVKLLRGKNGR